VTGSAPAGSRAVAAKSARIPRDEFAKAAAAATAAGVVTAAGKVAHDKLVEASGKRRPRGFRLMDDEPVPEGVARIALGRIDHALDELRAKTDSTPEQAVHEARKDLKKLRALLRLVRDELGDQVYRHENRAFREAAAGLSSVRDADVMIETLDALVERYPKRIPADVAEGLRKALFTHRRALEQEGLGRRHAVDEATEALRDARARIPEWPLAHDGFAALEAGVRRTYRRGRRAYEAALDDATTENLHELRKRVKDLWYHHTLLERSWSELMKPAGDEAHALSDLLGDDHDLAVLREWAWAHPEAAPDVPGLEALADAVGRRRAQLQRQALGLGARLYAERPRDFARRIERYWEAWRAGPSAERTPSTGR
jgi:CHAD domain-containing protein